MNLDKETIILMALAMIALLAWPFIFPQPKQKPQLPSTAIVKAQPQEKQVSRTEQAPPQKISDEKTAKLEEKKKISTDLPIQHISNSFISTAIDPNSGSLKSITLKKFLNSDRKENIVLDHNADALGISGEKPWEFLSVSEADISEDGKSYTLKRKFRFDNGVFELVQEWRIAGDYFIKYNVKVKNIGSENIDFKSLKVNAGGIAPVAFMTGDKVRREYHYISTYLKDSGKVEDFDTSVKETQESFEAKKITTPLKWIAVSNKYFACILDAENSFGSGNSLWRIERERLIPLKERKTSFLGNLFGKKSPDREKYFILGSSGAFKPFTVKPGEEKTFNMKYYSGPKETTYLEKFAPSATKIMNLFFAWTWPVFNLFGTLLEYLCQTLLALLIYFEKITGSYGIGIIFLTIIVRAAVWPFSQKANTSMKRMQKLQPLVQEIKTKYKESPQVMNQKVMALYKEHKVNPLGGCLPIFLQFPVFLALYCTIEGAVVLRQQPFLWCIDLCQPDTVGSILGFPIHPLIIVMTVLMVLQQKITPSAADPAQQKMMMFMPLIMLLFLYDLPSGLTLYWTISQAISIIQLVVNNRPNKEEKTKTKVKAGASA